MKYYYTDPLKAAWMFREFDFNYEHLCDETLAEWARISDFHLMLREFVLMPFCCEMLKPKVDDLVQIGDLIYWVMNDEKLFYANEARLEQNFKLLKDALVGFDEGLLCIIQRNGKAFFNPYVER